MKPFPVISDDVGADYITDVLYTRQADGTVSIVLLEPSQGLHLSPLDAELLALSLNRLARESRAETRMRLAE